MSAGLGFHAITAEEIALSILFGLVSVMRTQHRVEAASATLESKDPM
ncbi:hypothetical protein [Aliiruegeria haliotis]|nr:hypothetical protein [Aliiruegeria haliotis]